MGQGCHVMAENYKFIGQEALHCHQLQSLDSEVAINDA